MKHIVSRMSSYFPNRWPLSYLNLTKNMKTYIRRQQHIKQKEPPQKYRLGTISNTKLLAGLNRFYMAMNIASVTLHWNYTTTCTRSFAFSHSAKKQHRCKRSRGSVVSLKRAVTVSAIVMQVYDRALSRRRQRKVMF